jgi:lipid II:glycine glycyltransferase (peptidoglycan interpeptide bridge formation enzyme)
MNCYERAARKNVNKAIRSGLRVKYFSGSEIISSYTQKFIDIYVITMTRNSVGDFYYFNKEFFQGIARKLSKNSLYFFTFKDEIVISCELVLLSKKIGYSFLGGTLSKYFEFRPNDILKHEIINVLKKRNYNYFCLGGGSCINDGIFNYKKKFAKNGIFDFYIGRKIHNQKIYDKIVKQWEEKYPEKKKKYKNYLLKYRN